MIGHLKPGSASNCHPVLAGLFELTMYPQSGKFAPPGICSTITKQISHQSNIFQCIKSQNPDPIVSMYEYRSTI
ncbi:hypothetical protein CDAR_195701 [Caerostris darwini]|uniref:Uncharacterized protein n=1 Tax=Caerostris darwini TaxID=1538125 RepID=A0AAV4SBK2_9ARAC|nr:hypothetical protein CDAR_195701 [Caerostris darwini]